jgi:hypothetical protein
MISIDIIFGINIAYYILFVEGRAEWFGGGTWKGRIFKSILRLDL